MQFETIQFEIETSHIYATGNNINVVTKSLMKLALWWSFEELTYKKSNKTGYMYGVDHENWAYTIYIVTTEICLVSLVSAFNLDGSTSTAVSGLVWICISRGSHWLCFGELHSE